MGIIYVLFVATTMFTFVNSSDAPEEDFSLVVDTNYTLRQRFLRGEKLSEEGEGERLFGLEKVKGSSQSQLQNWLKAGKSTDDTFALLKLDEAGNKILKKSNLKKWAAFVAIKTGKSPEETMVIKLRTLFDDATLANMLEAGTKRRNTKSLATNLQNAQFKQWSQENKLPSEILDVLAKGNSWVGTPIESIWKKYGRFSGMWE